MSDGFQFSTFGPKRGVKVVTTLSAQSLTPVPDRVAETPTSLGDAYGADFHKYFESEPESEPNLAPESPKEEPVTFDAIPAKPAVEACAEAAKASRGERRGRRRALISAPVRLRSVDVTIAGPDEVTTTADV